MDTPADLPHAYVGNTFYGLPIDDKRKFIGVVFAYYYSANSKASMVVLRDHLNGKRVGTYSPSGGLDLD